MHASSSAPAYGRRSPTEGGAATAARRSGEPPRLRPGPKTEGMPSRFADGTLASPNRRRLARRAEWRVCRDTPRHSQPSRKAIARSAHGHTQAPASPSASLTNRDSPYLFRRNPGLASGRIRASARFVSREGAKARRGRAEPKAHSILATPVFNPTIGCESGMAASATASRLRALA